MMTQQARRELLRNAKATVTPVSVITAVVGKPFPVAPVVEISPVPMGEPEETPKPFVFRSQYGDAL